MSKGPEDSLPEASTFGVCLLWFPGLHLAVHKCSKNGGSCATQDGTPTQMATVRVGHKAPGTVLGSCTNTRAHLASSVLPQPSQLSLLVEKVCGRSSIEQLA